MPNSLDVDVDVDWLYRGKRRGKIVKKREKEHEAGSGGSSDSRHGGMSLNADVNGRSNDACDNEEKAGLRTRSASLSAQRNETTTQPSASSLKRSNSVGEKPKKSLFGSLFNRKATHVGNGVASGGSSFGTGIQTGNLGREKSGVGGNEAAKGANSVAAGVQPINIISHRQQITQFLKEPSSPEVKDLAPIREERIVLNKNPNRSPSAVQIKQLSQLSLKRVMFAVDKFGMDPPQQIPSRKPKRGNVLVPEDMISDVPSISQGITNTQGSNSDPSPFLFTSDSKEYKLALENQRRALKESEKHQQEAHYAAQRIATEVAGFKLKTSSASANNNHILSAEDEAHIKSLEIDKPIHMHEHHFQDLSSSISSSDENSETKLDHIYTRCCHLREILPIPSTLRQLKDKTAPLQCLKFLNPRPTLIDVLSFSDFIAIVPIHHVVFDNVGLTPEMFRIVISSLVRSTSLEKLSLRNVVFDSESWKLLCKFLIRNESVIKLDISQTKIKHDLDLKLHRSNMDWQLLTNVLQKRKGKPLEELLLNGVSFVRNVEAFHNLINAFSMTKTETSKRRRLGLAQSEISTPEQIQVLFRWMAENDIYGVDLAFNDFENLTKPIIKQLSTQKFNQLQYFTLNGTNITSVHEVALIIRELSKMPKLYFLDLSSLPSLFPDLFPYLNKYLPRFPNLKRLHLDSNEWTYKDLSMITQILPKCKELLHVSMMNQPQECLTKSTSLFLYDCVKNCEKLMNLDVNYEYISEEINSRIAIALVRNAQRSIDPSSKLDELSSQDDLLFDGELISETADNILNNLNNSEKLQQDATKRYLLKRYWEKMESMHSDVQNTIDQLFEERLSKELSLQSKENLLRLIFVENTLTNILDILSTNPYIKEMVESKAKESTNGPDGTNTRPVLKHVDSDRFIQAMPLKNPYENEQEQEFEHEQNASKPHLMATDSGKTIDVMTGRPILSKTSSQRSIFGKKQEEEEGELHKWGFFVQQQRAIYPSEHPGNSRYGAEKVQKTSGKPQFSPTSASMVETPPTSNGSNGGPAPSIKVSNLGANVIGKIPSGTELREAIIRAKGINSIEDLIDNVNCQRVELDNIYGVHVESPSDVKQNALPASITTTASHQSSDDAKKLLPSQTVLAPSDSEDSLGEEGMTKDITVDETYDKLLNNLSRVRSNKG